MLTTITNKEKDASQQNPAATISDGSHREVKALLASDCKQILEVFSSQRTIMKHVKDKIYWTWFEKFMEANLKNSLEETMTHGRRFYGHFQDGLLLSFLGQVEWSKFPFWTVNNLCVRGGKFNMLNLRANGLGHCMDMAAEVAERRDRFTFYWLTDADRWNTRERIWSRYTSTFKRYIILPETVIEPNCKPRYEFEFELLGSRTWDRRVAIKSAHLKKGYRHKYLTEKGLVTEKFVDLQGTGF